MSTQWVKYLNKSNNSVKLEFILITESQAICYSETGRRNAGMKRMVARNERQKGRIVISIVPF